MGLGGQARASLWVWSGLSTRKTGNFANIFSGVLRKNAVFRRLRRDSSQSCAARAEGRQIFAVVPGSTFTALLRSQDELHDARLEPRRRRADDDGSNRQ